LELVAEDGSVLPGVRVFGKVSRSAVLERLAVGWQEVLSWCRAD
jgi:hypothetical protein